NIIRARAGKTTLITTHRIATLKSVERILVMEKGELLEDGDHGGLLAMGGIYSTIYESKAIEAELEREAS
ncbi:MAG: multidrug ABC transporter permease/ATP-binding protein, partial [Deltaproteobacteria bacterium CG17_big_fil_post_rev_8_21_14_2_50_51_6]